VDDDDIRELLNKLSYQQVQTLTAMLKERGAAGDEAKLTEDQIGDLQKEADRYRVAQRQAVEAVGVLWNAQLDLAIRTGDTKRIRDNLLRPDPEVAFYDNCNCGGGETLPACW
jgi:hypothetical protein